MSPLPPQARELARHIEQGQNEIDALMRGLAGEISGIVAERAGAGTPLTDADLSNVMQQIDGALDRVYGPRRGADGQLTRLIVRRCQAAAATALRRSSRTLWEELERRQPVLMAVVARREAQARERAD